MIIFYCVLLVAILFLLFMEIITWQPSLGSVFSTNISAHITHVIAYVLCFICIAFLLGCHLYLFPRI